MLKEIVSTNKIASEVLFKIFLLHWHLIIHVKKKKKKKNKKKKKEGKNSDLAFQGTGGRFECKY